MPRSLFVQGNRLPFKHVSLGGITSVLSGMILCIGYLLHHHNKSQELQLIPSLFVMSNDFCAK